jgi:hypothetical protein
VAPDDLLRRRATVETKWKGHLRQRPELVVGATYRAGSFPDNTQRYRQNGRETKFDRHRLRMMLRISQSTHAMSATAMTTHPRQNARDAAGLLDVPYRRSGDMTLACGGGADPGAGMLGGLGWEGGDGLHGRSPPRLDLAFRQ